MVPVILFRMLAFTVNIGGRLLYDATATWLNDATAALYSFFPPPMPSPTRPLPVFTCQLLKFHNQYHQSRQVSLPIQDPALMVLLGNRFQECHRIEEAFLKPFTWSCISDMVMSFLATVPGVWQSTVTVASNYLKDRTTATLLILVAFVGLVQYLAIRHQAQRTSNDLHERFDSRLEQAQKELSQEYDQKLHKVQKDKDQRLDDLSVYVHDALADKNKEVREFRNKATESDIVANNALKKADAAEVKSKDLEKRLIDAEQGLENARTETNELRNTMAEIEISCNDKVHEACKETNAVKKGLGAANVRITKLETADKEKSAAISRQQDELKLVKDNVAATISNARSMFKELTTLKDDVSAGSTNEVKNAMKDIIAVQSAQSTTATNLEATRQKSAADLKQSEHILDRMIETDKSQKATLERCENLERSFTKLEATCDRSESSTSNQASDKELRRSLIESKSTFHFTSAGLDCSATDRQAQPSPSPAGEAALKGYIEQPCERQIFRQGSFEHFSAHSNTMFRDDATAKDDGGVEEKKFEENDVVRAGQVSAHENEGENKDGIKEEEEEEEEKPERPSGNGRDDNTDRRDDPDHDKGGNSGNINGAQNEDRGNNDNEHEATGDNGHHNGTQNDDHGDKPDKNESGGDNGSWETASQSSDSTISSGENLHSDASRPNLPQSSLDPSASEFKPKTSKKKRRRRPRKNRQRATGRGELEFGKEEWGAMDDQQRSEARERHALGYHRETWEGMAPFQRQRILKGGVRFRGNREGLQDIRQTSSQDFGYQISPQPVPQYGSHYSNPYAGSLSWLDLQTLQSPTVSPNYAQPFPQHQNVWPMNYPVYGVATSPTFSQPLPPPIQNATPMDAPSQSVNRLFMPDQPLPQALNIRPETIPPPRNPNDPPLIVHTPRLSPRSRPPTGVYRPLRRPASRGSTPPPNAPTGPKSQHSSRRHSAISTTKTASSPSSATTEPSTDIKPHLNPNPSSLPLPPSPPPSTTDNPPLNAPTAPKAIRGNRSPQSTRGRSTGAAYNFFAQNQKSSVSPAAVRKANVTFSPSGSRGPARDRDGEGEGKERLMD